MLLNLPLHAGDCIYLLKVADEGVLIILPVALQGLLGWELLTAELHRDLETVAAEVIEVLHPCQSTKWKIKYSHGD